MPTLTANVTNNGDDTLMEVIAQTNDRERINQAINDKKQSLARNKETLRRLLKELPKYEKSIVFLREKGLMLVNSINHFYAELTDSDEADIHEAYFLQDTRDSIRRYIDNVAGVIDRKKRQIEEIESVKHIYERDIKNLTRELLTLKPSTGHVFSVNHLAECLKPFGVNGVTFVTRSRSPRIKLSFDAMDATVNGAPFDNTPRIEIPPTCVYLCLGTRKVFVLSQDEDEGHMYYCDSPTPHPHIMGDDSPCFGDYDSPVSESIEKYDIETAAMLIKEYLSNVNHQDSAGRTWTRFYDHQNVYETLKTDETITSYVSCGAYSETADCAFSIRALHAFRKELILDVNENGELYFNENKFFYYNEEHDIRIDQDEIITSPDHPSLAEYFVSDTSPQHWDATETARFEAWVQQRERNRDAPQTAMDEAAQELVETAVQTRARETYQRYVERNGEWMTIDEAGALA